MGFLRFVLGLVAFVIAIKLVSILLFLIGFAFKLLGSPLFWDSWCSRRGSSIS